MDDIVSVDNMVRGRSTSPRERNTSPKERNTSPKERNTSPKERNTSPKERSTSLRESEGGYEGGIMEKMEDTHSERKKRDFVSTHIVLFF